MVSLHKVKLSETTTLTSRKLFPGEYLQLKIRDTGTGMDNDTKTKIFDPYFSTKEPGEGTGLGLAVVHGIVEDHAGIIEVDSELEQGTTFRIYLPVYEGEIEASTQEKQSLPLEGLNETIMLVDDEPSILNLIKKLLTTYKYRVFTFTNGVQAFQELKLQPEKYDLIITDLTMPYMTGTQLAQNVLEIKADMPIILCTGHSKLYNREKILAMGIGEYLEKPLKLDELLFSVRKMLDAAKINGVKILSIDDAQFNLDLCREVLSRFGCRVVSLTSGQQALDLLKKNPGNFDLVLTDQNMPNMTGLELAKQILAINPNLPIILFSGDDVIIDQESAKACGIKEILKKPLEVNILANMICRTVFRPGQ